MAKRTRRWRVSKRYNTALFMKSEFLSVPYWQFFFCSPINVLDAYQVNVRATDGAILVLCGPGEGDG